MSLEEFRNWNKEQIKAHYKDLKRKAFDLRFKAGVAQLSDYSQIKKVKKEIAQILTVAREKGFKDIR